jgi:hypothetical protein
VIYHDIEQNTEEWFDIRIGKVTTSNFGKFMANYGKSFGDPAKKYAFKIAKEQVTGVKADEESFSNRYMELGHEWEPVACAKYQEKTFNRVTNGGFCQHETMLNVGGSPDGLVGLNGGIEIKSVIDWTQRNNIKRGTFDPAYKWQILGNIWLCGIDWLDFVSYGYNYTDSKKLYIYRATRAEYQTEIDKIEPRLNQFLELIEEEKKNL